MHFKARILSPGAHEIALTVLLRLSAEDIQADNALGTYDQLCHAGHSQSHSRCTSEKQCHTHQRCAARMHSLWGS